MRVRSAPGGFWYVRSRLSIWYVEFVSSSGHHVRVRVMDGFSTYAEAQAAVDAFVKEHGEEAVLGLVALEAVSGR